MDVPGIGYSTCSAVVPRALPPKHDTDTVLKCHTFPGVKKAIETIAPTLPIIDMPGAQYVPNHPTVAVRLVHLFLPSSSSRLTVQALPRNVPLNITQTDEVILRVVAQYVFVPGNGQPTLLWLDSVETGVSSTQRTGLIADDESDLDANGSFMQLTPELVETNRSWTTFFPPKMADIASGKLAAGSGQVVGPSPRSRAFSEKHNDFDDNGEGASQASQADARSTSSATSGLSVPNGVLCNPNAAGTIATPLSPENHAMGVTFESQPLGVTFARPHDRTPTAFPGAGHRLDEIRWRQGQDGGFPAANYAGGRGRSCRDNFTLPTESWSRRSSRWAGLDGWGKGGRGDARSGNKQWVRRRSTGTTMRLDDRRLDLRHGSESHRPQTAPPPRALGEARGGGSLGKRRGDSIEVTGGRLPSKKNG